MLEAVVSVLPLLLLILTGIYAAGLPWFGEAGMQLLSKFLLNITIPVLIFSNVIKTYPEPSGLLHLFRNLPYPVLIAVTGFAVGMAMAGLLRVGPPQRGVFVNAVALSNIVVMGVPVTLSLFGEEVIPAAMVYYASNTLVFWTLGVWLLRRECAGGGKGKGGLAALKAVLRNKPLLGFLLGILWVCGGVPMPGFMMRAMGMLGSCTTALAMVFIGCVIRFADFRRIDNFRELVIVIGYRFLAVPVITGILCSILPVDPIMKKVFFLLANMPAMAQLPLVAKDAGSDYELASMVTATTTVISMAAVPVYVALMQHFNFPA